MGAQTNRPDDMGRTIGKGDQNGFRRSDMLVLSRKRGEKIVLGNGITLTVVEVRGKRVRLAFDAPDQVHILRAELVCTHDESARGDGLAEPASECGEKSVRSPEG